MIAVAGQFFGHCLAWVDAGGDWLASDAASELVGGSVEAAAGIGTAETALAEALPIAEELKYFEEDAVVVVVVAAVLVQAIALPWGSLVQTLLPYSYLSRGVGRHDS